MSRPSMRLFYPPSADSRQLWQDMTFDSTLQIYHYPCPCGDRFEIAIDDLRDGEDIAVCPSCSLMIKVIFEVVSGNDTQKKEGLKKEFLGTGCCVCGAKDRT